MAAALRPIYAAASAQASEQALQTFADGPWGSSLKRLAHKIRAGSRTVAHLLGFNKNTFQRIFQIKVA